MQMGCCDCFGFLRRPRRGGRPRKLLGLVSQLSQERLLDGEDDDEYDDEAYNGEATNIEDGDYSEMSSQAKRSEGNLLFRIENGLICRQVPVEETCKVVRSEDEDGNKMINEYIRECKIGAGSYVKVVLCRNTIDGRHYAVKVFHKSYLLRQRVAPSETAMTDVLREVCFAQAKSHPVVKNPAKSEARRSIDGLNSKTTTRSAAVEMQMKTNRSVLVRMPTKTNRFAAGRMRTRNEQIRRRKANRRR